MGCLLTSAEVQGLLPDGHAQDVPPAISTEILVPDDVNPPEPPAQQWGHVPFGPALPPGGGALAQLDAVLQQLQQQEHMLQQLAQDVPGWQHAAVAAQQALAAIFGPANWAQWAPGGDDAAGAVDGEAWAGAEGDGVHLPPPPPEGEPAAGGDPAGVQGGGGVDQHMANGAQGGPAQPEPPQDVW
jgi:hypothetical protein